MAAKIVQGIVNSLGESYKDSTPNVEIRVPKGSELPYQVGSRVPVTLKIGKQRYEGKLHATEGTKFLYFSPTLVRGGTETTLGHVFKEHGVATNARLRLKVTGTRIQVCDKWGNGLETSAAKLNTAIGSEPKSLAQICAETGVTNMVRVYPHMKFLKDNKFVTQLPGGQYVAAQADDPHEAPKDSIIAERIIRAIAELVGSDLNATFLAGEVRKRSGVPSGSLSPVLKGMRDVPGTAPLVREEFRNTVQMVSRGVYRLTEYGRELVKSLQNKPSPAIATPTAGKKSGGAGFGSAANNKLVEDAARAAVWAMYKADNWEVESVEHLKCGHDLVCRKGDLEEHVELKGASGPEQSFPITRGEVRAAQRDAKWQLCVVTSALSAQDRKITKYTRDDFLVRFDLTPIKYMAKLVR